MELFPTEQRCLTITQSAAEKLSLLVAKQFGEEIEGTEDIIEGTEDIAESILADIDKAIELSPSLQAPYVARSQVFLYLKQFVEAKQDAMKAFEINPNGIALSLLASLPQYDISQLQTEGKLPKQSWTPTTLEKIERSLECPLCLEKTMTEPVISSCGHSFCRPCIILSLDHDGRCPVCRLLIPGPGYFLGIKPNKILSSLKGGAPLTQVSESEKWIPIFVCSLALPGISNSFHIFEPRYRVLVRESLDANRPFGICLPPKSRFQDGPFDKYGTMVHIQNCEAVQGEAVETSYGLLPRFMVEVKGVYRFHVKDWKQSEEGLFYALIERLNDDFLEDILNSQDNIADTASYEAFLNNLVAVREHIFNLLAQTPLRIREMFFLQHGQPPDEPDHFIFWAANVLPMNM
ncbi:hypothetical protein HDU97_002925 [Phlyctochytrium planicorne]|nr:hypothetical protein HDU97_002925 [Phlyctochytrium planicorne]